MTRRTPSDIAHQLGSGLLSFPVTHFAEDFSFDEKAYRDNLDWLNQHGASGLFAAGGTGEFFSLTLAEVEKVVTAARQQTQPLISKIDHDYPEVHFRHYRDEGNSDRRAR